ncbi:hypothetical protein ACR77J_07090 [Tissierella praeacuta]|uniref:hypothetical protein n=1 Tax=Tissierella praeacuta TaxID=43131 RepID=UPI003DA3C952
MSAEKILNEIEEHIRTTEGEEKLNLYQSYPRLYATISELDDENITVTDLDRWYNNIFSSMDKVNFQNMLKTLITIIKTVDKLEDNDEFKAKYIHLSNFTIREIIDNLDFYIKHLRLPPRIVYNIMRYGWDGKYRKYL